jgi:hypothetical protein
VTAVEVFALAAASDLAGIQAAVSASGVDLSGLFFTPDKAASAAQAGTIFVVSEGACCGVVPEQLARRAVWLFGGAAPVPEGCLAAFRWPDESAAFQRNLPILIAGLRRLDAEHEDNLRLRAAAASRGVIDRAKHVLMDTYGYSEDEAYRRLQRQSMDSRLSLHDIAQAVVTAVERHRDQTAPQHLHIDRRANNP